MEVSEVMKIYNVRVVHAISPSGGAGSPDVGENIPIWDRFTHAVNSKCDVRCSTINEKSVGLWYPVGLILKKGTIRQAYIIDGGTSFKDGKVIINDAQPFPISEQVKIAIETKKPNGYNELVVTSPEYEGIYFRPSDVRMKDEPITEEYLHRNTSSLGLKYYMLTNDGNFLLAEFDGVKSFRIIKN